MNTREYKAYQNAVIRLMSCDRFDEILDRYMNETPGLHLKRHKLDVEVSAEGETPIVAPLYQLVGAMKGLTDDAAAALVIRWASWVTDDMTLERTH